jgi:hypothetical protein
MATNTCARKVTYNSLDDIISEPFRQIRADKAQAMFNEGKTESYPNVHEFRVNPTLRDWVDHAAAQEWIDFLVAEAPTYNISIVAAEIVDY